MFAAWRCVSVREIFSPMQIPEFNVDNICLNGINISL